MQDLDTVCQQGARKTPWNKGKLLGAKPPLRTKHVWAMIVSHEVV